jgi:hypothetical protein
MEDAQVISGNGLVDRNKSKDMENMKGISVADYARMRQADRPGSEIYETRKAIKQRQKPLRILLEGRIKMLALADMRKQ